jgi:hypothetical protein
MATITHDGGGHFMACVDEIFAGKAHSICVIEKPQLGSKHVPQITRK